MSQAVRAEQLGESMKVHTAQGLQRVRPWRLVLADGTPTNVGLFIDRDKALAWAKAHADRVEEAHLEEAAS